MWLVQVTHISRACVGRAVSPRFDAGGRRPRGEGLLAGVKYKAVLVKIVGKFLINYNIIIFYLITGIPRIKKIFYNRSKSVITSVSIYCCFAYSIIYSLICSFHYYIYLFHYFQYTYHYISYISPHLFQSHFSQFIYTHSLQPPSFFNHVIGSRTRRLCCHLSSRLAPSCSNNSRYLSFAHESFNAFVIIIYWTNPI